MRRRRTLIIGGLVVISGAAFVLGTGGSRVTPADADANEPAAPTGEVATRDLVEREELDGTLGYGERTDIALVAQGAITGLPEEGSVVDRGGSIAEVDGRAVGLLFGTRPLWRPLDADVGNGPDVRQLEENLVALGHATTTNLAVDDDWTDATTAAVKR